jgi:Mor family transcriptional regulator
MNEETLLSELKIEDLKELHQEIAEAIGIDGLIKLSEAFGGSHVYIPKTDEITRQLMRSKAIEEYNGGNMRKLIRETGKSESTMRKWLKDKHKKIKSEPIEGQISFLANDYQTRS